MKKLIVLIVVFIFAVSFSYAQTKDKKETTKIVKTTFSVKGMTCSRCVANVGNKLKKIDGVKDYKVSLKGKSAEVKYDSNKLSEKDIADIMNKTNYKFKKIKKKEKEIDNSKCYVDNNSCCSVNN